jgi:signal transduction histidine kinase
MSHVPSLPHPVVSPRAASPGSTAAERALPEPVAARLRIEGRSGDAAADLPCDGESPAAAAEPGEVCEVQPASIAAPGLGPWLRDHAVVLLPAASAIVLATFAASHVEAVLDLAILLLVVTALAAGHFLMRSRRERRSSAHESVRLRQELELRARVAECEARRARLSAFSELAAQIAHEVRNPLSSIVLNTELLEEELGSCASSNGGEMRSLVTSIKAEAARLHTLTDEYLTFARLPRAEPVPASINALVEEIARFTRAEIAGHGLQLRLHLAAGLPDALIDQKAVRQVLLNLLRNATEATPAGGRIDVFTGATGSGVRVEVRDTGRGIPAEVRGSVFDPFFSTKSKGTGLGLAVARRIVTDHGGTLAVADSDAGARLVFTLPEAVAAPPALVAAGAGPLGAGARP